MPPDSLGLGTGLVQEGQPVAYAVRARSEPKIRNATMEKEILAIVVSFERWHQFVYGRLVKPLGMIPRKPSHRGPRRLQSMLITALAYDNDV